MAYSDVSYPRIQPWPCLESGAMSTGNQDPPPYNSQFTDLGVSVIDQAPESRFQPQFPIYFSKKGVLSVSIIKCVVGSIQLILGIINIIHVPHWTSEVAAPIWCGVLFVVNGIIGCVLWKRRSKCLMGAFCGLSVASFVLSTVMLVGCSLSLDYFADDGNFTPGWTICDVGDYSRGYCYPLILLPRSVVETSLGLLGFLMALIVIELGSSISAIFYSCKAYSSIGCCELIPNQRRQQPRLQQQQLQQQQQRTQETSFAATQGANPCSAILNVIISLPGASYLVDTVRSGQNESQAQTVRVTIHPCDSMQTNGSNEQTDAPGSFNNVS
ncbi:uncharacterized protein LOC135686380 [Rhopilema esculentum]|uniref:uncharacterized protein LOC135686380 n=1 Tax=Rhopilema esculentum TaxID=499914 RepID=UPI0031D9EA55